MSIPRLSVDNPIAANFLMLLCLLGGAYFALTLPRELFPAFKPTLVTVVIAYPGSSPVDVEKGVLIKIEEAIHNLDNLKKLSSNVSEGMGSVTAEFETGTDMDQAVNDIKAEIDRLQNLPVEVEEISVRKVEMGFPVIGVMVYGDTTDRNLKAIAEDIKDELLALDGVTKVSVTGLREPEIAIEVEPGMLEKYGLTFQEVARQIGNDNIDLPGGQLKTAQGDILLRTLGERVDAYTLEEIILRTGSEGQTVRLKDVAVVRDGFKDAVRRGRYNGKPAARVMVSKTPDQDAIDIADAVKAYVAEKKAEFQGEVQITTYGNSADFIEDNLRLLIRSATWGLILVLLSLTFFLNFRIAFWTAMGIPVALLGTFIAMWAVGYTTNLMTFFGLIIILGMVVDDAIVLGENVFRRFQEGLSPRDAAIQGAEEISLPIVATILTTIAAFAPFLFARGAQTDFARPMAGVVVCALLFSLVEAFGVLPSHLEGALRGIQRKTLKAARQQGAAVKQHLLARWWAAKERFIDVQLRDSYTRLLRTCIEWRYVSAAAAVTVFVVVVVMIFNGRPPMVMMQEMDGEMLYADLEMLPGSSVEQTVEAIEIIEMACLGVPDVQSTYSIIGQKMFFSPMSTGGGAQADPATIGQVLMELRPVEERGRHSDLILDDIRSRIETVPGAAALKFEAVTGRPESADFEIRVRGDDIEMVGRAVAYVRAELARYQGVEDIRDNLAAGKLEARVGLNPLGRISGLTVRDLAVGMRSAVFGAEAQTLQRGREEVEVRVRLAEHARDSIGDLEQLRIATPAGGRVPFTELGRLYTARGYATLFRLDRKRTVQVEASLDENNSNETASQITARLQADLENVGALFPGVSLAFGGERERMQEARSSLIASFLTACLVIYGILALVFRSYVQPVIIMAAVPFGLVGAALGHLVMGYPLTSLSWIGLIALSGVVVNDSLILIEFINRSRARGLPIQDAILEGGRVRLRPILLTSITTILGLMPLLAAHAFEAQMIIPIAISLSYGLAFATVLTLLIVPCFYFILDDLQKIGRRGLDTFGFESADAHSAPAQSPP